MYFTDKISSYLLGIDYSNETVLFGKHKFNQDNILVIYYAKLIVGAVNSTKWIN